MSEQLFVSIVIVCSSFVLLTHSLYMASIWSVVVITTVGRYASLTNTSSCSYCSPGSSQLSQVSSHSQQLPTIECSLRRTDGDKQGTDSCDPCVVGRYSSQYGSITCNTTSPGTYQVLFFFRCRQSTRVALLVFLNSTLYYAV
jgi:hypothetical protein